MRIMGTVAGVLLLAVLGLGWMLKGAWEDTAAAQQQAAQAGQVAAEQRQQAEALLGRLDALDTALKGLQADQQANQQALEQRLRGIENITKSEGDTDASMACLDQPAPAQLVERVR